MSKTPLERLHDWYKARCNGEWEHRYGVSIETLDNPGWLIRIDLAETHLASRPFERLEIQRADADDWATCWRETTVFQGTGGPSNLEELLCTFLDWAEVS